MKIFKFLILILNERGEAEAEIKVSLFASAVRIPFYPVFLKTLLNQTSVPYEVVFCGHNTREELISAFPGYLTSTGIDGKNNIIETCFPEIKFRYIHTGRIKPAQCYEIARRECRGETIQWTADDAEHTPDLIGKAYRHWKSFNDEKVVLSIQTLENNQFCDMRVHSFFGCQFHTPLMAPLALMSAKLMESLGGFDRRYICGQYENDAVMRVIEAGGRVEIFGDKQNMIILDHYRRHGIHRPFATGYNHDRQILEDSWTDGMGNVFLKRKDALQPYLNTPDLYTKSQSFNNANLWV